MNAIEQQSKNVNIAIGKKLKKARVSCDLTQEQAAKYLDVKREVVSYYENGSRPVSLTKLNSLADLYGYDVKYFLSDEIAEEQVSLAFRATNIKNEDLETIARVNRFANNLHFLNSILEERGLQP